VIAQLVKPFFLKFLPWHKVCDKKYTAFCKSMRKERSMMGKYTAFCKSMRKERSINNFFKRMFLLLMFCCLILICPHKVLAAVSIPWSITFDCDEWLHDGRGGPKCDSLVIASDSRTGTRITTAANYPGGGGGRGLRQYLGDGTNQQTSGLYVTFPSQSSIWIRWYMRYEEGFAWTGNWPGYDKWLYIRNSAGKNVVPEWDGDEINIWAVASGNHKNDNTDWRTVMGGLTGDGEWHCYEVHLTAATSSTGIGYMWIDGVQYLFWTNINYGTSTGWTQLVIGSNCKTPSNGSPPGYVDFDDIAISNTEYIGPIAVDPAPSPPTGLTIVQ